MCFNIGVIIGPIIGGFMADPINSFPRIFGPNTAIGGKDGVAWMRHWPYALPNLFSASFIFAAGVGVILFLVETHPQAPSHSYTSSNPLHHEAPAFNQPSQIEKYKLPFSQIWTRNVLWTL